MTPHAVSTAIGRMRRKILPMRVSPLARPSGRFVTNLVPLFELNQGENFGNISRTTLGTGTGWMAMRLASLAIYVAAVVVLGGTAQAQLIGGFEFGSASRGALVFAQCRPCHSLDPGQNLAGPTLHALFGRTAGSVPGYRYSLAMRNARIIWTVDSLSEFLANPRKVFPKSKVAHLARIADPSQLGDLLAFLEQSTR